MPKSKPLRSLPTIALLATLLAAGAISAQSGFQTQERETLSRRPTQPTGQLGSLGAYRTIEGLLYEGGGKVESNTLVVDVVDGKHIDEPIYVLVKNARIPAWRPSRTGRTRCNHLAMASFFRPANRDRADGT